MILSVHLARTGPRDAVSVLRRRLAPDGVPGLIWAQAAVTVPLAAGVLPPPRPTGVGLIAAWSGDEALDDFLERDPSARRLAGGWHVRLQPLRASGSWTALPGLAEPEQPVDDDEPVAVVTLGRLRPRRAVAFLRTTAPAEREAVADPALVLSTALARPPQLVATFSVWDTAAAMRSYAYGSAVAAHVRAIRAHRARPFHHESVFARFRPYAARGAWRGTRALVADAP